ncbi:hypothetical protein TrRE_jg2336 [Triparma retinervis]|uniref:Uncharacterized protein n=1 Tax=Triparma retinervis TaxID=2557542 RepID=A0A9W7CKV6_9STRA|nr:hypothetical protein TrRE_jg2336 [Triparma retinervis]
MKTEESNRCNLSIMLDHSHVLSRNRSLLRLVDSSTLSSAQGVPAIVSPKQGCLTGQAMLEVKKAGLGGVEMGPLKVKWLRAEVRGVETIRMKMEVQDEASGAPTPSTSYMKKSFTTLTSSRTFFTSTHTLFGSPSNAQPYAREGASVSYSVHVVAEMSPSSPPLRPTRGGSAVVKFVVVKPGGTRVRGGSGLESREVGRVGEGGVVCVDQKEWFYGDKPDPERRHPNNGFWRVHVVDVEGGSGGGVGSGGGGVTGGITGRKAPLTGWITGKSSVIDPVQPSPFFEVGVGVVVGATDVWECGIGDTAGMDITTTAGMGTTGIGSEIPQAKICVYREEVITIKKDRRTHRRTNVCRIRSLKWGPILPQSVFTRPLAIPVSFASAPPSLGGGGNLQFRYFVSLEADVAAPQRRPLVKVGFVLMEGSRPEDISDLLEGGEGGDGGGQGGKGGGMRGGVRGGYGKMTEG